MKKKILVACLCVALAVLTIAGTTLAYLTSQDTVENTFTVGNVAITLDEAKVDTNGKALTGNDAVRVKANTYKLMPGHVYDKDPIIHVDSASEDCYLFVTVKNDLVNIEKAGSTVAEQMKAKGWVAVDGVTGLYVYVGTTAGATDPAVVVKSTDVPVFEKIVIAETVDNDTLATYVDKTIVVNAYAVQKDGFDGKDAAAIWSATFGN